MKLLLSILVALACVGLARAQSQYSVGPLLDTPVGPAALLGVWGNAGQCRAHRDGGETNPARLPYVIDDRWISQGFIFCSLAWRGQETAAGEVRAWADARCGEDNLRDYRLQLRLRASRLEIRWSPDFVARDLRSCRS